MKMIDINQALPQMSNLIEQAFAGEEILITKNKQAIKITCVNQVHQRPPLFGSDKDQIMIADDFDAPLDEFEEYQ